MITKLFRILILSNLFLFPTFAFGEEGEVRKDFRILLTKDIYIKPEVKLDIKKYDKYTYTVEDDLQIITSVIFEF